MYVQYIITFFIATLFSIHGKPTVLPTLYDTIKLSAGDPNLKCPYVRTTKLLEPEPEFFKKCTSFITAQTLTKVTETNINDALCLLYYNYFERLCNELNTATEDTVKGLLSNITIDEVPTTYQKSPKHVCEIMMSNRYFIEKSKPGIEVVEKRFEDGMCQRLCTDFDDNVKPICSLSAFMINITKSYNQTQKLVLSDVKPEKGPNKPQVTEGEHNADIGKNLKIVPGVSAQVEVPANEGEASIDTHENHVYAGAIDVEESSAVNPKAQEQISQSQTKSFSSRWEGSLSNHNVNAPVLPVEIGSAQQITTVRIVETKVDNADVAGSPKDIVPTPKTTLATFNTKSEANNEQLPIELESKSKANDVVNEIQNAVEEDNNANLFEKPDLSVIQEDPKKHDEVTETKLHPNDANENTHQAPAPVVEPKELKDHNTDGQVVVDKVPTKNGEVVKLDEPRQDVQDPNLLPDEDDDIELGQADMGNDREEYNELLPKSSEGFGDCLLFLIAFASSPALRISSFMEMKRRRAGTSNYSWFGSQSFSLTFTNCTLPSLTYITDGYSGPLMSPKKSGLWHAGSAAATGLREWRETVLIKLKSTLPEKSKPLETIEGVPSFAANYQNQSIDDSDSYFFSYFMMVCIMFICGYVAYHNKQKILALVVEGRRGRRPSRTRRPNSANYRKLDSNLEEAVTSSCNKNATQVIY